MPPYFAVDDCLFVENSASQSGGAIFVASAPKGFTYSGARPLTIFNSTFGFNHAGDSGGAIKSAGLDGSLSIRDCKFERNTAEDGDGGAVEAQANGESSLILVEESSFDGCIAQNGGAIHVGRLANLALKASTFVNNMAVH